MIFLTARGLYGVGDTICVYRGHTLEPRRTFTVTGTKVFDDHYVLLMTHAPLDGIDEDDLIENISAQPRIHISDCRFGKAISHLRIQSRGEVLIENRTTKSD